MVIYQSFDDIKVSDKGMIKLIRNNGGKDYIFPASKITKIQTKKDTINLIALTLDHFFDVLDTFIIHNGTDSYKINIRPTKDLLDRIEKAREYSNKVFLKKYGEFK